MKFLILLFILFIGININAQQVRWTAVAPSPNSIVGNDGLFIQLLINDSYTFQEGTVQVLLDGELLNALTKVNGHKLSIIYEGTLPDGKHTIEIKSRIPQVGRMEQNSWIFFVNRQDVIDDKRVRPVSTSGLVDQHQFNSKKLTFSGTLSAESRHEFISGSGAALRQEPSFTGSINADIVGKVKDITIPVKFYTTSDNRFIQQTPSFYNVGFKKKWLDAEVGDMNPSLDKLILTGVRMRGVKLAAKLKTMSLQIFYGYMNQSYEGKLETYAPGLGVIPTSLTNDTQYIIPGTYKRWMTALRFEKVNKKGTYKIGFNAFKAKDDTTSIKYGLEPKDNLAASMDLTVRLFQKRFTINTGLAASVLTKDIKYGALGSKYIDSVFHTPNSIDPYGFQSLIVVNASSQPLSLKDGQFLAGYAQGIYNYKNNYTSVEYRRNGGGFYSLGNPFLRNNYNGININQRLNLMQNKVTLGANFQDYSNNVNESSAITSRTTILNGNTFLNLNSKYPSLFLSFMQQSRISNNSLQKIDSVASRKSTFSNLTASLNYNLSVGKVVHSFRTSYNANISNDDSRPDNKVLFNSMSFGVSECINKRYNLSADIGKTTLTNASGDKFSNLLTYSAFAQFIIDENKANAAFGISNNVNTATLFANQSTRMSFVLRGSYRFYKGMSVYLEAATQPYRESMNTLNNFDEKYVYIKWMYEFGR